jgi:hypothetical protein
LFAKAPDATSRQLNKQLEKDVEKIANVLNPRNKKALLQEALKRVIPPQDLDERCTVRADLLLVPEVGSGNTILVDASITHITSTTAIDSSYSFHRKIIEQERKDFFLNIPTPTNVQTPQVAKVVKAKGEKYGLLEKLMNIEAAVNGTAKTVFVAGVVTHRGEMAGGLIDMFEGVTLKYRSFQRQTDNLDGYTPARAAALFRSSFKSSIFVALTKGWGMQLLATGFYRARGR